MLAYFAVIAFPVRSPLPLKHPRLVAASRDRSVLRHLVALAEQA